MQSNKKSLFILLSLNLSGLYAAKPIILNNMNYTLLKQELSQGTQKNLKSSSLNLVKQHVDSNKINHIRVQQYYNKYPVMGADIIFHSRYDKNKILYDNFPAKINGKFYQDLGSDLHQEPSDYIEKGEVILKQFKSHYPSQQIKEAAVKHIIYVDNNNIAHWAYKISLYLSAANDMPKKPVFIVDYNQKTLIEWNDIQTISRKKPIKGIGYGGNVKLGSYLYGKELPYLSIMRNESLRTCYMENDKVKVIDMQHRYDDDYRLTAKFKCMNGIEQNTVFWTGYDENGYDEINEAYSPMNDALHTGMIINQMYKKWYDIDVLTKDDGSPMTLLMRVHYGNYYSNAYWDGQQMTFGDGGEFFYPLVSLGIGAHEISHGFTEQHSNLLYFGQSGGLNESFSDMAAQAAEFYATKKNSWLIGNEIVKPSLGMKALRFMEKPSLDGNSIDYATDYTDYLDVHFSSGVFNRLFYILAHQPSWDTKKAFDVMIKANMDYWVPMTDFQEAGCGAVYAAQDLNYNVDGVKYALEQVALKPELCQIQ